MINDTFKLSLTWGTIYCLGTGFLSNIVVVYWYEFVWESTICMVGSNGESNYKE